MSATPKPVVIEAAKPGQRCYLCRPENAATRDWLGATLRATFEAGMPRPSPEALARAMTQALPDAWYIPHQNNLRGHLIARGEQPEWFLWDE